MWYKLPSRRFRNTVAAPSLGSCPKPCWASCFRVTFDIFRMFKNPLDRIELSSLAYKASASPQCFRGKRPHYSMVRQKVNAPRVRVPVLTPRASRLQTVRANKRDAPPLLHHNQVITNPVAGIGIHLIINANSNIIRV